MKEDDKYSVIVEKLLCIKIMSDIYSQTTPSIIKIYNIQSSFPLTVPYLHPRMIWIDMECFETGYILIPEIYSFTENVYTQIYIFVYRICIWWIHAINYFRVFIYVI